MSNVIQRVHDPCITKQGDAYYLFSTGRGIPIRRSRDLVHWDLLGRVFNEDLPGWAKEEIPGSVAPWAPDIACWNGRYYLYYSVSTFGKNRSLIGLATNNTLDPESPNYAWNDEGKVFESFPTNRYNAIDSNVLRVGENRLVFAFGSFWSGIKLVEANPQNGTPVPGATVLSLARRPSPCAIEAPFLIQRGGLYYLFVSFDYCCRGANSTYNIRVGRSEEVEGPYQDRDGTLLLESGGSIILATEGWMIGPGHCAVLQEPGLDLLVYHYYDARHDGIATLGVRPLLWDEDGWPYAGSPMDLAFE